ncbi:MAG: acyltransferase [Ruminococcaceae bacterium]|nr:acyltransferase [Oscillospiraceae bacterium]
MERMISREEGISPPPRIFSLAGLKGLAALIVFANHFGGAFFEAGLRPWEQFPWLTFFFNGTFMLHVFYTVSGLFTAYSLFRRAGQKHKFLVRLINRYIRLVIPVLLICLIICLMQRLGFYAAYEPMKSITLSTRAERDAVNYYSIYPLWEVFVTAFKAPLVSTTKFTFVIWMLPYIFQGFIVSLIFALLVRSRKPALAVCMLLAGCLFLCITGDFPLASFVIGVLIAYAYLHLDIEKPLFRVLGVLGMAAAFLAGSHWPGDEGRNVITALLLRYLPHCTPLYVAGAAALVAGILILRPLEKLFSARPFVWLGNTSLGIFLTHDMFQIAVGANVFLLVYRLSGSMALSQLAAFLIAAAGTLCGGYVISKHLDPLVARMLSKAWRRIGMEERLS